MNEIEVGGYWLRVPWLDRNGETQIFQDLYYIQNIEELNIAKKNIREEIELSEGKMLREIDVKRARNF